MTDIYKRVPSLLSIREKLKDEYRSVIINQMIHQRQLSVKISICSKEIAYELYEEFKTAGFLASVIADETERACQFKVLVPDTF